MAKYYVRVKYQRMRTFMTLGPYRSYRSAVGHARWQVDHQHIRAVEIDKFTWGPRGVLVGRAVAEADGWHIRQC